MYELYECVRAVSSVNPCEALNSCVSLPLRPSRIAVGCFGCGERAWCTARLWWIGLGWVKVVTGAHARRAQAGRFVYAASRPLGADGTALMVCAGPCILGKDKPRVRLQQASGVSSEELLWPGPRECSCLLG